MQIEIQISENEANSDLIEEAIYQFEEEIRRTIHIVNEVYDLDIKIVIN